MKLTIAARKSDLARLQAFSVGKLLRAADPRLEIEYKFRESLGDKHLEDPLWKMPERGVFTQDFHADIVSGACDLVVHSWKDLPLELPPDTEIAGTLPRADSRDLLVVSRKNWERSCESGVFQVLSSSPRRAYNLETLLPKLLPHPFKEIHFVPVRGNVQTRLRKLLESAEAGALVVAKAAIDRLLEADEDDLQATRTFVRQALSEHCRYMVLPLRENPTAAAQGALAIEILSTRDDLRKLIRNVNCENTFANAQREREILGLYGGGCHQKIGVSVIDQEYGKVLSLRGLTHAMEVLSGWSLEERSLGQSVPSTMAWPASAKDRVSFFDRIPIPDLPFPTFEKAFWVARAEAWPKYWPTNIQALVWASGTETWSKLAQRGIWVSGSNEGLGESWEPRLENLENRQPDFLKLSHDRAPHHGRALATYHLQNIEEPDFKPAGHEYFYWMSGSQFERALELYPELRRARHACGPGNSFEALRLLLGPQAFIEIFLSFDDWLQNRIARP